MPYSTLKPSTKRMKQSGFKRNHAARLRQRRAMQATKPRAGSRRELIRQLDDEVRRIVRARDVSCVTPSTFSKCFGPLEVSHYLRRGYQSIRWDLRNVHLQCRFHNQEHSKTGINYRIFMFMRYGNGVIDELEWTRRDPKLSDADLQNLLADLRVIAARAMQTERAA